MMAWFQRSALYSDYILFVRQCRATICDQAIDILPRKRCPHPISDCRRNASWSGVFSLGPGVAAGHVMETSERVGESAIQLLRPCRMQLVRSVRVLRWDNLCIIGCDLLFQDAVACSFGSLHLFPRRSRVVAGA
jgi:hypothetical protein